jgi:hypothetical protein
MSTLMVRILRMLIPMMAPELMPKMMPILVLPLISIFQVTTCLAMQEIQTAALIQTNRGNHPKPF